MSDSGRKTTGHATSDERRGSVLLATVIMLVVVAALVLPAAARDPGEPTEDEFGVHGPASVESTPLQTSQVILPRATYLHTNQDDARNATAFMLSDLGVQPGETIRIERRGEFNSEEDREDDSGEELGEEFGLTAVFSVNDTLLPRSERDRVPGAVAAGNDFVTSPTFYGNEPTDISEDFQVATRDASSNSTTVTVPDDARYIFLSPQDDLFEDNADFDEDFGFRITVVNEEPTADFNFSPSPSRAGEQVTFDASASSDPDGTIEEYRWDFNGDDVVDNVTTDPITTWTYDSQGGYEIVLTVEDDDGATGRDIDDTGVRPPSPTARCTATPETVTVDETVTIDVSASEEVDFVEFDTDGDGEYEMGDETDFREMVTYDEPGQYSVRARVTREEEPTVVDCGTVTVESENLPPRADIDHDPVSGSPGVVIVFNASNSRDRDGNIVEYRWDFGANGTIDRTTSGPTVSRRYPEVGNYTARVIVVDDNGATDADEDRVPIATRSRGDGPDLPGIAWIIPALLGGAGAGYAACRGRGWRPPRIFPTGFGGSGGGIVAVASGTFETPTESDTVTLSGLGFEPDLLLFTATSNVTTAGSGPLNHTDGWTYGCARRDGSENETFTQRAVSVADDVSKTDAAVGSTQAGQALDLLVYDDESANGLAGRVTKTNTDGFEMAFDAAAFPEGQVDDSYAVMFQAFALEDADDVEVGHFLTPTTPGDQTIDLDVEADHVLLTANNVVGEAGSAAVTDGLVGLSRGAVAAHGTLDQQVVNSTVDPSGAGRNSYAAFEDRALHLIHGQDSNVTGHTIARATLLGEQLELTYHDLPTGPGEEPQQCVVSYVAIDAGGDPPAIGHVEAPAPDASRSVELGFSPSMVDCLACGADRVGEERTVEKSPLAFGWSHGTAMPDGHGGVVQHIIQGTLDASAVAGHLRPESTAEADGADAGSGDAAVDGDQSPPPGALARTLALDDSGRVTGGEDVRATVFRPAGFDLETTAVGTDRHDDEGKGRPILFYHAWPPTE